MTSVTNDRCVYYAEQDENVCLGLRAFKGYEIIPEHLEKQITSQQRRFLDNYVYNKSAADIEELKQVEQGSEQWRLARVGLITASNMGAAVGLSPYKSSDATAYELVYVPFMGNAATEHGKKHEPIACARYIQDQRKTLWNSIQRAMFAEERTVEFMGKTHQVPLDRDDLTMAKVFDVKFSGLNIDVLEPWRGCSLDGTVWVLGKPAGVLEIKAPHNKKPYPCAPLQYYCQVQANMHITQLPVCDFYVWTCKKGITLDTFHYDAHFCNTRLMPKVREFYFTKLLPHLVAKQLTVDPTLSGGKIADVVGDAQAAASARSTSSTGATKTSNGHKKRKSTVSLATFKEFEELCEAA